MFKKQPKTVEQLTPEETKTLVEFMNKRVLHKDSFKHNLNKPITIEEIQELERVTKKMEG